MKINENEFLKMPKKKFKNQVLKIELENQNLKT